MEAAITELNEATGKVFHAMRSANEPTWMLFEELEGKEFRKVLEPLGKAELVRKILGGVWLLEALKSESAEADTD